MIVTARERVPWVCRGERRGVLLNNLQCTEQPLPQRFIQRQMSAVPKQRIPATGSLSQLLNFVPEVQEESGMGTTVLQWSFVYGP